MKKSKIVQTSVAVFIAILILISTGDTELNLTQYKWKNRLLFVFAPHSSHRFSIGLKNAISIQKEEILDRDLIIFQIFETGSSFQDLNEIHHGMAEKLRLKFRVAPGHFTVILVGKDGGVKLRRKEQVHLNEIFLLIDGMPMRREEMRRKYQ